MADRNFDTPHLSDVLKVLAFNYYDVSTLSRGKNISYRRIYHRHQLDNKDIPYHLATLETKPQVKVSMNYDNFSPSRHEKGKRPKSSSGRK